MDQATGRPARNLPLAGRLGLMGVLLVAFCEASLRLLASPGLGQSPVLRLAFGVAGPLLRGYVALRGLVQEHPVWAVVMLSGGGALLAIGIRAVLLVWHNQIKARLSDTFLQEELTGFPSRVFDLVAEVRRRPSGTLFVGMQPVRGWLGWRWTPVYLSQRQKSMHRHVVGKTGSGKTQSILWPAVFQDLLDGKGVLVMDAKGSDENVGIMKGMAAAAGRSSQLRIFSLPAWNQPQVFSHSYNCLYVRPVGPGDSGGDVEATAERVFSVLPLGDNQYYNVQAQIVFVNTCKLLHGIVDETGHGFPFTLRDVSVVLKALGVGVSSYKTALEYCCTASRNQVAVKEIQSQLARLERDAAKCFTGIIGALDKFQSPIVNAYAPDLVIEEVLQQNLIVYAQLPANLFKIQAPAMGKMLLMDVQQEGSLRQVFRRERNQRPFSVNVDEFYNFADLSIIDSLNKLRDANLEYTLAHQSIADLELVSKEFSVAVWDNTRTKDILNQDNPELCERLAKSIGTQQVLEKTVRRQEGALLTSLATGDASTKLVEAYRLHPNRIKGLARCGQGFLLNDEGLRPVAYSMLPPISADYGLPKKDQAGARGLRLYERFIAGTEGEDPRSLAELVEGVQVRIPA